MAMSRGSVHGASSLMVSVALVWAESLLLLLHLLLLKENLSLGIHRRMIHELLINVVVELIECFLNALKELMES